MTKKILFTVMAVVLSLGLMGSAFAFFDDEETSTNNLFTAGTVNLTIGSLPFNVTSPPGMAPGDVVYNGTQVSNGGTLELRYAMTTTPDGASILDEQLDLTIDVVTAEGTDATWYTADDVVGATIYGPNGVLSAAAVGNPAQGQDGGDRVLSAGSSERLRFTVTLPGASTGNAYQGLSATVAFVFSAEQTANNP